MIIIETTTLSLTFGTYSHTVFAPLHCPYCGKAVEMTSSASNYHNFGNNDKIYLHTLYVKCCKKHVFCLYHYHSDLSNSENESTSIYEFISSYPEGEPPRLPESIGKISPRFIKLYNDSSYAESKSMNELAGTGYRNSLEILIKDFVINELSADESKVKSMSLFDVIGEFLKNEPLLVAADVVRVIGNDLTHYERKYEEYDLKTLKAYLDIFISLLNTKYLLLHPPVARQE